MNTGVVLETSFPSLDLLARGKVRDVYSVGNKLLIVSTDRLSAFDVVLPDPIPSKGRVLNSLSIFWMRRMEHIVPNHIITADVSDYPAELSPYSEDLAGRSVLVRKAKVFPVECVARGYVIGSGWKDYQAGGSICGIPLPAGLELAQKLPEPIFTPSTKAQIGDHDENISFSKVVDLLGEETAKWLRDKALELYLYGAAWAEERGIIIADTKFEFGVVEDVPTLVDEVLTPDSSRFWPVDHYAPGRAQSSYDKQFVRDYLLALGWNKEPPAPPLPADVVAKTRVNYLQALALLAAAR